MRLIVQKPTSDTPDDARRRLETAAGVTIVADNHGKSFIIEADSADESAVAAALPGWDVFPERAIAAPAPPYPRQRWTD